MKRFLRRLIISVQRDDLFLRVVFVQSGLLSGGLGIALLVCVSTNASTSPIADVLLWTLAILLTAVGGLMTARCAVPAQSRPARSLDRNVPDAAGLEDAIFLIGAIYLPAPLLTLVLRLLGVPGQRKPQHA